MNNCRALKNTNIGRRATIPKFTMPFFVFSFDNIENKYLAAVGRLIDLYFLTFFLNEINCVLAAADVSNTQAK